jgi:L-2-hydroxyglutarate oxidase LhgO
MDADVIVIGAGAVGLSVSYYLSKSGYKVILVEKEKSYGLGVSSRSTEVIHSGAYYATNSLKGSLCIKGKNLLYTFCPENNIAYKKIPKLFIAQIKDDYQNLIEIQKKAKLNGLTNTQILGEKEVLSIEPQVSCYAALLSPSSGVFDSQNFMHVLYQKCTSNDVTIAFRSPFEDAVIHKNFIDVKIGGDEPIQLKTKYVVNSAGLGAINVSKKILRENVLPKPNYLKGIYARYHGKINLNHIIYPSFSPGIISERVDTTPDINGSLRFGPSVERSLKFNDFSIPDNLVSRFFHQLKSYLKDIDETKILPDYVAYRPKIIFQGNTNPDFIFHWDQNKLWLDLWGMESPALTASLAIGEYVENQFRLINKND